MTAKTAVKKIAFNLKENSACALCYVLGWVSGLAFLLAEKENKKVRFHAMQSLIFFGGGTILLIMPVFWILWPLVMIVNFVVWLMAIYKTYNGEEFELPVVGKIAKERV